MMRHYLLNDDGKTYREIDPFGALRGEGFEAVEAFAKQLADSERRNVGDDEIQAYRISTKFIGIDTSHISSEPRPFECMAFGPDLADVLGRFTTWEQANAFHTGVVMAVRLFASDSTLERRHIDLAVRMMRGHDCKGQ